MSTLSFSDIQAVVDAAGSTAGPSAWRTISQEEINRFADLTNDHQWIHTDPERAKTGPYGTTVVHGYFLQSMVPDFLYELVDLSGFSAVINYGTNKVRLPHPLPVDTAFRASVTLGHAEVKPHGTLLPLQVTVEIDGADKPALVAETLTLIAS